MKLIDADETIREIVWNSFSESSAAIEATAKAIHCIENMPSIERKKGKWIVVSDGYGNGEATACICECSECKDTIWVYKEANRKWNFCPNCGADMRGK